MTYLFGNILLVSAAMYSRHWGWMRPCCSSLALFYKEFVAVAFDEEFARSGVPVRPLTILLLVLIALSVVIVVQVVGIVLVITLLPFPC
jgi:zinc transport system permease protein